MEPSDAICKSDEFYCYSLSNSNEHDLLDIEGFEPIDDSGAGLARYLKESAFNDEVDGSMRTYLVRDCMTAELVGYFSLKAGLVSLDESNDGRTVEFDTVPGVELANFAINKEYRLRHPSSKGCGMLLFRDLILEMVRRAAQIIGVYLLYIYSLPIPIVMENYANYGFVRLPEVEEQQLHSRLKPRYDRQCVFMYMAL